MSYFLCLAPCIFLYFNIFCQYQFDLTDNLSHSQSTTFTSIMLDAFLPSTNPIISSSIRGLPGLLMYVYVWDICTFYYHIIISGKINCSDPIFIWCFMQAPFPYNWLNKLISSYFALQSVTIIFVSCWNSLISLIIFTIN
jgi:hypothetical protein